VNQRGFEGNCLSGPFAGRCPSSDTPIIIRDAIIRICTVSSLNNSLAAAYSPTQPGGQLQLPRLVRRVPHLDNAIRAGQRHPGQVQHVEKGGGKGVAIFVFARKMGPNARDSKCLACHGETRDLPFWNLSKHRLMQIACDHCHSIHSPTENHEVNATAR
jgi:hypothetical protein